MSLRAPERHLEQPPAGPWPEAAPQARLNALSTASYRVAHLLRKCDPKEWGGSETAIERLCQGLREHGVNSVVYCPRLDRDLAQEPWEHFATVRRFRAVIPIWGLASEERRQMIRVGGNLMSFQLIAQLWREPDLKLVHTHALGRVGGIGLTIAQRRRLPFVVTIHGGVMDLPFGVTGNPDRQGKSGLEWGKIFGLVFRSRRILQEADAIVTCNPTEAQMLRDELSSRRIIVQPHGIPLAPYRIDHRREALQAFPQLEGRQPFLCAGRLDPIKNPLWLVEQWPEVLRRHPKALLVLAGPCTDPVYGEQLGVRIRQLGLDHHVLLTGGLPATDARLIGLFQRAEAVVLASRSETFGLVIIEAWAAGTPVIASRTSGACALLEAPHHGWLFELDPPDQFHRAMDDVLLRPAVVKRIVAVNEETVSEHDQTAVAGRMKRLYDELIQEHHALRGHTRR